MFWSIRGFRDSVKGLGVIKTLMQIIRRRMSLSDLRFTSNPVARFHCFTFISSLILSSPWHFFFPRRRLFPLRLWLKANEAANMWKERDLLAVSSCGGRLSGSTIYGQLNKAPATWCFSSRTICHQCVSLSLWIIPTFACLAGLKGETRSTSGGQNWNSLIPSHYSSAEMCWASADLCRLSSLVRLFQCERCSGADKSTNLMIVIGSDHAVSLSVEKSNFPFEEKLLLTSFSRNMINNLILFSPFLHKMKSCSLVFFIMWALRERYIVSFRKHHWNVTFECSPNVPKQAVTFQNIRGTSN